LKHGVLQVNKAICAINLNIYQEHVDTVQSRKTALKLMVGNVYFFWLVDLIAWQLFSSANHVCGCAKQKTAVWEPQRFLGR